MRLTDRVVIITGGAQGLGQAYARRLASEGARLVIADKEGELADAATGELRQRGFEALGLSTDVANGDSVSTMVNAVLQAFGRVDVLVNNAGGALMRHQPAEQISEETWDLVVNVNLKGQWLCARAVIPTMKEQRKGKIINVASATVFRGYPVGLVPYIAAKAGVIGLTRALARELGDFNICVNTIAPSHTPVPTLSKQIFDPALFERITQQMIDEQCFKRTGTPEDLTGAVAFLASDEADFITGQVITVDGGWTMA